MDVPGAPLPQADVAVEDCEGLGVEVGAVSVWSRTEADGAVCGESALIDNRGACWSLQATRNIARNDVAQKQLLLEDRMLCKFNV